MTALGLLVFVALVGYVALTHGDVEGAHAAEPHARARLTGVPVVGEPSA